ncbi:MAG TPA: HAD family phosphatase [Candidatus Omnitrophota bacterium]|nr:HAD family phosphatase [Candidatus Omnitrophota bacterium]
MPHSDFDCQLFLMDLGNVLVKFDHGILARDLAKLSGRPIMAIVSQFISSGLGELYDRGKISSEEFLSEVIKSLKLPLGAEELKNLWCNIFSENPGMESLVERIKRKYPIWVISDTNELHFEYVKEKFSVLRLVDGFILSYQVGELKPHPRLFEEALRRSRSEASKTFFADDRGELVRAASKLGFHAFRFRDAASFEKELSRLALLD